MCHYFSDTSEWLSFINSTTTIEPWVLFATECLTPYTGMTQSNSHTNLPSWAHLLLTNTCQIRSTRWQPIPHSGWIPRYLLWDQVHQLQPTVSTSLLPGNLLVVIIVLIFLQPLHGSCGRIGSPTEDLHGANQFLGFSREKQPKAALPVHVLWTGQVIRNLFTL